MRDDCFNVLSFDEAISCNGGGPAGAFAGAVIGGACAAISWGVARNHGVTLRECIVAGASVGCAIGLALPV